MKNCRINLNFRGIFLSLLILFSAIFSACNFNQKSYTVSYKTEYGTAPASVEIIAGSTLTIGQTAKIFCKGRSCEGWYDGDVEAKAYEYVVNKDVTLVAKWNIRTYSISYYRCEKTDNPTEYTVEDFFVLQEPEKEGYIFEGWYTHSDYTGEPVKEINNTAGNLSLYAKWNPIDYTITYVLPEGITNSPSNPSKYNRDDSIYLEDAVVPEDLAFGGWYINSDYSEKVITNIDDNFCGDITLYGKVGKKISIYLYSSKDGYDDVTDDTGSDADCTISQIEGSVLKSSKIPEDLYSDFNYHFCGWFKSKSFDENSEFIPDEEILTEDTVLYAKWAGYCTVTSIAEGKEANISIVFSDSYITEDLLPVYHTEGKKTTGWYTSAKFTENTKVQADVYKIEEDVILYAKWEPDDTIKNGKDKDGFVLVEGGPVGSSLEDYYDWEGIFGDGSIVHLSDFVISPYEVTQNLYTQITGENPSRFENSNNPVESVSFYDALYFCNKYSISKGLTPCYKADGNSNPDDWNYTPHKKNCISGKITCDSKADGYRLPTSAEWEYAARGGQKNLKSKDFFACFSGKSYDDDSPDGCCWYWNNICSGGITAEVGTNKEQKLKEGYGTHEVGKLNPNALGLYDMSGNVWELLSCTDYDYFTTILRAGGAWDTSATYCTVTYKSRIDCEVGNSGTGFRLVRTLSD